MKTIKDAWIYDQERDMWVSPTGRLAEVPGAPFKGQISKLENAILRRPQPIKRDIRAITLEYGIDSRGVSRLLDSRIEYK